MKYLAFSLFIAFSCICTAQTGKQDILYLKNGSVIYGTVKDRSERIKVQISGGSILVFRTDEIDSIRQESAFRAMRRDYWNNYYRHDKGFRNITEVQFIYGPTSLHVQSWEYYYQSGDDVGISVHTINGYQIWPYLYLGAGVGMDRLLTYRQTQIPLFLRINTELLKKRITPYLFGDVGYAFLVADQVNNLSGYSYYNRYGGIYATVGGGLHVYTHSRASWLISAGYRYTQSEVHYAYSYQQSPDYITKSTFQRLVVSVGLTF